MLKNLTEFICVSDLLKNKETFLNSLLELLDDVDLAPHSCELYKVLSEKHSKENIDSDTWIEIWVKTTYKF